MFRNLVHGLKVSSPFIALIPSLCIYSSTYSADLARGLGHWTAFTTGMAGFIYIGTIVFVMLFGACWAMTRLIKICDLRGYELSDRFALSLLGATVVLSLLASFGCWHSVAWSELSPRNYGIFSGFAAATVALAFCGQWLFLVIPFQLFTGVTDSEAADVFI